MGEVRIPFTVEVNYAGWRLDRYLQEKLKRASRARVQQLIRERLVHEEAHALKPSTKVRPGLRFWLLREDVPEPPGLPEVLPVLFDDGEVLVIDKPAGLPVHPTARYFEHTVTSLLGKNHRGDDGTRPDPAHRLDRETSGVLVCGRGRESTRRLKALFAARTKIDKIYLALCACPGPFPEADAFTVDAPLAMTSEHAVKIRMSVVEAAHPEAKRARTKVTVESRLQDSEGDRFLRLRCELETGRQHQIRAHLAHVGLPVVGDKIYGGDETIFIRFVEGALTADDRARLRLARHALHASRIVLPHPSTGRPLTLDAPLPDDLRGLLEDLRPAPGS